MKNIFIIMMLLASSVFSQDTCTTPIVRSFQKESNALKLWADATKFWSPGSDGYVRLTVKFLDGYSKQKAETWKRISYIDSICNGIIVTQTSGNADIRISFKGFGHWSYIGTDNKYIKQQYQTMNIQLSIFDGSSEYDRVVYHEFFHALGFQHEHQHPNNTIPWNKTAVYAYYRRSQGWSKSEVDNQVLKIVFPKQMLTNGFDRQSIMLYPISNELTIGDFSVGWNKKLSPKDIQLLNIAYQYEQP